MSGPELNSLPGNLPARRRGWQYILSVVTGLLVLLLGLIGLAFEAPNKYFPEDSIVISVQNRTYLRAVYGQVPEGFDYHYASCIYYTRLGGWFESDEQVLLCSTLLGGPKSSLDLSSTGNTKLVRVGTNTVELITYGTNENMRHGVNGKPELRFKFTGPFPSVAVSVGAAYAQVWPGPAQFY